MSDTQEDHSKFASDDEVKDDTVKSSTASEECPICLHEINNKVTLKSCKHGFCKVCIEKWCKVKSDCPVCRCKLREFISIERILNRFIDYDEELEEDGLMQTGVAVPGLHYYIAQRFGRIRVPSHQLSSYVLTRPDVLERPLYR